MASASPLRVQFGSADAIDDDWLLEGRKRRTAEGSERVGSKKKRRKLKVEDVQAEMEEPFLLRHTASRQQQEFSHAASEYDELRLKKTHFVEWAPTSDDEDTPTFTIFLEAVCLHWKRWVKALKNKGSPLLLVLTVSAVRATELRKQLLEFTGGSCTIAKLFAKHMKMEEQSSFMATHITPAAVATPARLKQLLDARAVGTGEVKWVVLDWYWRDQKLRKFSDVPEVWDSFADLYCSHLHQLIRTKQSKLILF